MRRPELGTASTIDMFSDSERFRPGENEMKINFALASAFVVGFVLSAGAQTTTTSYYVVQDVKTKKCEIVDQKPVSKEMMVIGGDEVIYHSRTEAESALKTVKVCHTE